MLGCSLVLEGSKVRTFRGQRRTRRLTMFHCERELQGCYTDPLGFVKVKVGHKIGVA